MEDYIEDLLLKREINEALTELLEHYNRNKEYLPSYQFAAPQAQGVTGVTGANK